METPKVKEIDHLPVVFKRSFSDVKETEDERVP